ncbi:MAG: hypothetical protein HYT49_00835 [Candidatus Wildermuthbacteria bacterium]|nr:hypothetical protein [Candidatus Wildermuthbacteria bacterium]
MNTFLTKLTSPAEGHVPKILLPEPDDERVQQAMEQIKEKKFAEPISVEIDGARAAELEKLLLEVRSSKVGTKDELTVETARKLAHDPLWYGAYLLRLGEADGLVAGVSRTTAEVLRAGLWLVGKAEGIQTVSSSMYMIMPPFRGGEGEEILTFADCAVVPDPTAEQLADIAVAAADARFDVVGDEPRVALLSYSTHGSGSGVSVGVVRNALALVKERRPELIVDGEMQVDAALDESISARKAPGNVLGGHANVLIFPSLDAANIAYKLVVRLVPGAIALGPIVQGLKKPISDLSRGATVEEIAHTVAIVASQVKS